MYQDTLCHERALYQVNFFFFKADLKTSASVDGSYKRLIAKANICEH